MTQIQCYKNASVDIDAYLFHFDMTEWYHALIIRALRRVLKKELGVEFSFTEYFNKVQEAYKETANKVIEDIMEKENYLGKKIIRVPHSCVPTEEEKVEEKQDAAPANKNSKGAKK